MNQSNAIFQLPTPNGMEIKEIKAEIEVPRDEARELMIKQKLYSSFEATKELIKTKIQFSEPLLTFDGLPVLYPGSLTTLQGRKGSMKSRITELFVSSFIANLDRVDTIFKRKDDEDFFCVYFDTERHQKEQFPSAMQNIIKAAGHNCENEYKPHFAFYSLIDFSRNNYERFEAMKYAVQKHRAENPKKRIVIVIDVMTDLVGSFNDVNQTMEIIDYLNVLCNEQDISAINVIHENKNDQNSRGHLGSESTNKSSVVCRIENDKKSKLVKLSLLHTRSHKEPDAPFYFEFDESTKLLKRASIDEAQKVMLNSDEVMQSIMEILSNVDKLNRTDICQQVKEITKKSEKTIDGKLKEMAATGMLFAERVGRAMWYGMAGNPIELIAEQDEAPLF